MKQDEFLAGLQAADRQLKKAGGEIGAKLAAERELANPHGTQAQSAAGLLLVSSANIEIDGAAARGLAGAAKVIVK